MPAVDSCEEQIIHALEKEGWRTTDRPYTIDWSEDYSYVFADMRLQKQIADSLEEIIVVEAKCFTQDTRQLYDLYVAVGQYLFYRHALTSIGMPQPVYLAVPDAIYRDLFHQSAIQGIIKDVRINMIVVDLDREEITRWITWQKS